MADLTGFKIEEEFDGKVSLFALLRPIGLKAMFGFGRHERLRIGGWYKSVEEAENAMASYLKDVRGSEVKDTRYYRPDGKLTGGGW